MEIPNSNDQQVKGLIKETFDHAPWAEVFVDDLHHGFTHGNQTRLYCLELIKNLTPAEREKFLQEGQEICGKDVHAATSATLAAEIAAIFHDCGRFNDEGKIIPSEQRRHNYRSAERAKPFCKRQGLPEYIPHVEEAILCHDFQNSKSTPYLNQPGTIIGKLVQAADQTGWFHPDAVHRTIEFSKEIGRVFYDPSIDMKERLDWTLGCKREDALTFLAHLLVGYAGPERFGIEAARLKLDEYRKELRKSILKAAWENQVGKEAEELLGHF